MCEREAVNPERAGGLCPRHHPDHDTDDGGDLEDQSQRSNPTPQAGETALPAFDFEALRYIQLRGDGSKLPAKTWGGYSQDFDDAQHVLDHQDVTTHPAEDWGVVDVKSPEHGRFALLIFDIDIHKAPDGFDPDRVEGPSDTLLVRSQNGGFHVYFVVSGYERGDLQESDFKMTQDPGFDVDIRGSVVSHHVVAPANIPGIGGPYEVCEDNTIKTVFEPQAAAERITLDGEPLLEFDPGGRTQTYEFDVPAEPPEDMPTCYHAGLELRKAAPDDHPNTHKVNMLTAACGLAAGYDLEEVARHFCGKWAPTDGDVDLSDKETTEYQVQHIKDGRYSPPAESTLRAHGILDEDQHCDPDCPIEYHGPSTPAGAADLDPVVTLPDHDRLADPVTACDWRHAGRRVSGEDPVERNQARTTDAIVDGIKRGGQDLIEALPTLGKSYGAVKAAAETGERVTILTPRGRKEQYAQIRQWCDEHGLKHYTLPSFTHDCDTANREHGEDWAHTVKEMYHAGATPQDIHKLAENELGRPLPCQEYEGQQCPYTSKWQFEADDVDVLIGHPLHAYNETVTLEQTVFFDEFCGNAFETYFGELLESNVSEFLASTPGLPFDNYTDLIEGRQDDERRADGLAWFDENGVRDPFAAFGDGAGHAHTPLAAFTLLAGATDDCDLGNGWELVPFPQSDRIGVFDRENNEVHILNPPNLGYASGVIALDGTPTKELWELSPGTRLNHRQVLADGERQEYLSEGLGLNIVQITDAVKPYNNDRNVNVEKDAALLEEIADQYGRLVGGVISTQTALTEYDAAGVLTFAPETQEVTDGPAEKVNWHGNVLGSNEFKETRLGAVIGSNHYGDRFIERWGAYAGEAVERNGEKGKALSYGEFGDKVLTHMRKHNTLQAVMRFGRDGNGATIYVATDTLPDWVPVAGEGRVIKPWSQGTEEVLTAVEDLDEFRTPEVADHPAVSIGQRQVFNVLNQLADRGYLNREADGRGYTWRDDGIHRINDYGEVELDAVSIDEASDEEVAEMARCTSYTWDFRNSASDGSEDGVGPPSPEVEADQEAAAEGDPPPDPGE